MFMLGVVDLKAAWVSMNVDTLNFVISTEFFLSLSTCLNVLKEVLMLVNFGVILKKSKKTSK